MDNWNGACARMREGWKNGKLKFDIFIWKLVFGNCTGSWRLRFVALCKINTSETQSVSYFIS